MTGRWRKMTGCTEKRLGAAPCRFGLARTLNNGSQLGQSRVCVCVCVGGGHSIATLDGFYF